MPACKAFTAVCGKCVTVRPGHPCPLHFPNIARMGKLTANKVSFSRVFSVNKFSFLSTQAVVGMAQQFSCLQNNTHKCLNICLLFPSVCLSATRSRPRCSSSFCKGYCHRTLVPLPSACRQCKGEPAMGKAKAQLPGQVKVEKIRKIMGLQARVSTQFFRQGTKENKVAMLHV